MLMPQLLHKAAASPSTGSAPEKPCRRAGSGAGEGAG